MSCEISSTLTSEPSSVQKILRNKNLRHMWRLDLHPSLEQQGILVKDDTLFIVYPTQKIMCSEDEKIGRKEGGLLIADQISSHLCRSNHYDRVTLLPDGREVAFPFDVIQICSHCRVICKDAQKHFKNYHNSCLLKEDDGKIDLKKVSESPHSMDDLLKICSPISEFPDPHLKDSRFCSQFKHQSATLSLESGNEEDSSTGAEKEADVAPETGECSCE